MHTKLFPCALGFRDGWLYLVSSDGAIARLSGWPHLVAEIRRGQGSWTPLGDDDRNERFGAIPYEDSPEIARHFGYDRRTLIEEESRQLCFEWAPSPWERRSIAIRRAVERFLAAVPPEVRSLLPKVRDLNWVCFLEWAREMPRQLDLLEHDRHLALALARHWEFPAVGAKNWPAAREVGRRRRRDVLGWLGYSPTEATANALRRFDTSWSLRRDPIAAIGVFLSVLKDPSCRSRLSSCRRISGILVETLSHPEIRPFLNDHVVGLLVQMDDDDLLTAHYNLEEAAHLADTGIITRDTLKGLLGTRVLKRGIQLSRAQAIDVPFQHGPAPTATWVKPIESVHALMAEGETMGLCVGSPLHLLRGVRGEAAYYHIDLPRPATLALRRQNDGGDWLFEEIAHEGNAMVSIEEVRIVQQAFPCIAIERGYLDLHTPWPETA